MTTASITTAPLAERIQRCRRQQQAWAHLPVRQRLRPVRQLRRLLVSECNLLCASVASDLGKTPSEALAGDVLPLADACRFLEREAARLLRPRTVSGWGRPLWLMGQSDQVHRRPRGVVGLIGTWNYPLFLAGVPLVQALTAGNGVLWKPSEVAPASAAALFGLLARAGFPDDLVQLLEATRSAGQDLVNADIDHLAFTGSSRTGPLLAENLGRRLVRSTLELSGCDALFVLDDADVPMAVQAAWFGATMNRGQTCLAVRRVFIPRRLSAAFTAALKPLVEAATPVRLALAPQVQQVDRLVQEALAEGASLAGGRGLPARPEAADLCQPVVVLDARPEMGLCRDALFAPVMAVLPYDDLEDAVRMDAQCPYGLGASIFTRSPARAAELAARLRTGTVAVNDVIVSTAHPATPFGGRGMSGWGVTQGAEGLLEMTVPQVVSVRSGRFRPHYEMAAGRSGPQSDLLWGFLEMGHGLTLGQRCRGFVRLLRGLLRKS
jgi:acyl-CoA reductase-like NAD-dependent aldehyde dehydrogenase